LESAYAIKNGVLPNLSEQNLVDCATSSYGNVGCNGGFYTNAWNYIKKVGINTQKSYPYTAKNVRNIILIFIEYKMKYKSLTCYKNMLKNKGHLQFHNIRSFQNSSYWLCSSVCWK